VEGGGRLLVAKFMACSAPGNKRQKARVANSSGSLLLAAIVSESTLPPQKRALQKLTVAQRIRPHRFTYEKCPPGRHKLRSSTLVRRQTFPLRKCVKQFFPARRGRSTCNFFICMHVAWQMKPASREICSLTHSHTQSGRIFLERPLSV